MIYLKEHQFWWKTGECNWKYNKTVSFRVEKNPDLLQEEEENVADETNDYACVNAEANKVDDKKKNMFVKIK